MPAAPPILPKGRPRKRLSDQLDRLDEVINGLEECLPDAVAGAARDGIRQAFRDVVADLVRDPAVIDRLREALVPEIVPLTVVPKPSAITRLKAILRTAAAKVAAIVAKPAQILLAAPKLAVQTVAEQCSHIKSRLGRMLTEALPLRSIVFVAPGVGLTVATISLGSRRHYNEHCKELGGVSD